MRSKHPTRSRSGALISPPHIPYAPALSHAGIDLAKVVVVRAAGAADTLWSMEQALRSGTCSAVLGWPTAVTEQAIRRLQLATETGHALGAYFTRPGALARTSPVPYRLRIDGSIDNVHVDVLKRRGGGLTSPLHIKNTAYQKCCGCARTSLARLRSSANRARMKARSTSLVSLAS